MESALSLAAATGGVAAALLLLLRWRSRQSTKEDGEGEDQSGRQPPSVGRYPLIGSLLHLEEPLHLTLYERYGHHPIVLVHFGIQPVYVFNRWPAFRAAMLDNAEQMSGRMSQLIAASLFGDVGGVVHSDGDIWREYRRFTLKTLRDFGFGRRGAEEIVRVEAEQLRRTLDEASGAAVETSALMSTATSNVICQLVFGSRLASEDANFAEILHLFSEITQKLDFNRNSFVFFSSGPLLERFPVLLPLIGKLPGARVLVNNFKRLQAYCNQQRERHAAEMAQDGVDRARDYIDAHLLHQRDHPDMFTDVRLTLAVSDLFIAGTDTTSNALRWAVLYLIANPDVAEKAHREIVESIGQDRLPTMQDKPALQYTQAVIEEVHRKASLISMGVFHRVIEDITVDGVRLKANSICAFNVYAMHHDSELFPEPQRFLPERHLTAGQFTPSPHLATFGLGKRACLGESLARMELLILLTALLQRYRFSLDPNDPRSLWDLTEDPEFVKGVLIRSPPKHKIVFTPRS